ncbi:hypothetical protein PGT21_018125 [Puccinia graminis f. sp. tritici]|uniref:Kinesin-like protein n=1 Tax=Puccinia graminis f. sp. tritici TaxID=56615 RepID=A0A5B0R1M2_PUCGR|nr:hypothetical protein PGT21_018125 [Puccinia graminis f. sp. tritici]
MAEERHTSTRGSSFHPNVPASRPSQNSPVKNSGPLYPPISPSRPQQQQSHSRVRESRTSSQNTPFSPANRNPSPVKRGQPLTKPPRPSSRPTFSSTSRATSPTKVSVIKQNSKTPTNTHASPTRTPLWPNGRAETGLGLNIGNPTPGRSSPTRQPSLKPCSSGHDSMDSSLMNVTFVSAASGIDENQPLPSSAKPKEFKSHQSSILAGLGFSRIGNQSKSPILPTTPGVSPEKSKNVALKSDERHIGGYDPKREPLKAYLRIRPPNAASTRTPPYISILNDTEVLLAPPTQSSATGFAAQESVNAKYKFTRVYGPEATQQEFFQGTGLPLVADLLDGKSSLCFAYGVTASGKTYTVQGGLDTARGGGSMDPGLLPRTMDVLFNSIGCNLTELPIKPARLTGIEIAPFVPEPLRLLKRNSFSDPSSPHSSPMLLKDQTILPIDTNCEYGIWISYAEVYNEKVYDLLDTLLESSSSSGATFQSFTANLADQVKNAAHLLHTKASHSGGVIKRKPLTLKHDKANGNKYIHGLTEIRVKTAEEAKILLRHGQVNRTVFSTYANRTSSRSHGIFTIKVIKLPKNIQLSESMLSTATVSRLSIVDLAGSERTRNTQTTGQRLKEAGNINKSLMVLGQCMETLRRNQEQKEKNRKMTIVPFRHSKLTELFQSFFTGEGKTVMIVNVNPCDTGFDENSHVMKFSAVASEVVTVREEQHLNSYAYLQDQAKAQVAPPVVDETSFILEDEDDDDETENEDGAEDLTASNDAFVDHLLEQVSSLRVKLVEAEIRSAMIEAEIREQVMQEYNQKMLDMEALFTQNMANEAKEAELKADRKIDIFNRATQHLSRSSSEELNEEGTEESRNPNEIDVVKQAKPQPNRSKKSTKKQPTAKALIDSEKEADDDDPTSHLHQPSSDHRPEAHPVRELRPRTQKS